MFAGEVETTSNASTSTEKRVRGTNAHPSDSPLVVERASPADITADQVFLMARKGMTDAKIADYFRIRDRSTINKTYAEHYAQGRAYLTSDTLDSQVALKSNVAMAIFRGKNYCEQSDKLETVVSNADNKLIIRDNVAPLPPIAGERNEL